MHHDKKATTHLQSDPYELFMWNSVFTNGSAVAERPREIERRYNGI